MSLRINRLIVLDKLNALVKDFVYRVGLLQGLSEEQARNAGGKIFTFGSYRLGVHGTGNANLITDSVAHSKDDDDDDDFRSR